MTGFLIAYLGSFDYVAAYGVPLYPFGYLPVLVFIAIAARTIRRYFLVHLTPAFAAGQILATVADPVIVCDSEGVIRFTMDVASRSSATRRASWPAPRSSCWPSRPWAPPCVCWCRRATRGRRGDGLPHPAGGEVEVGISLSPLTDDRGVAVGAVLVSRDVTERKRVESRSSIRPITTP